MDSSSSYSNAQFLWWKSIWRIEILGKVKIFLRRTCNHWLPTLTSLAGKGVVTNRICPVCKSKFETTVHALWRCPGLKSVCKSCAFMKGLLCHDEIHFHDFFQGCLNRLRAD
ncbi:hypothetical protein Dsin_029952 [Dipteronia sinensis]|uniref:Reverse transcriptase zinc-binding domain-containing protein n=1 Tax=Dipteronia sinensis TaxID=43782 RepID=A0AAD9ZI78_9ROSI|nr:hypothetical protein Dsin_029952 [Dipteronia sinensis]